MLYNFFKLKLNFIGLHVYAFHRSNSIITKFNHKPGIVFNFELLFYNIGVNFLKHFFVFTFYLWRLLPFVLSQFDKSAILIAVNEKGWYSVKFGMEILQFLFIWYIGQQNSMIYQIISGPPNRFQRCKYVLRPCTDDDVGIYNYSLSKCSS